MKFCIAFRDQKTYMNAIIWCRNNIGPPKNPKHKGCSDCVWTYERRPIPYTGGTLYFKNEGDVLAVKLIFDE